MVRTRAMAAKHSRPDERLVADGLVFDSANELLPPGFELALEPVFAAGDASLSACDAAGVGAGAGARGAPFVACEVTFAVASGAGPAIGLREGVDGLVSTTGAALSLQTAFVPATIELVPEPDALASGAVALGAIGRLRRRRRGGSRRAGHSSSPCIAAAVRLVPTPSQPA